MKEFQDLARTVIIIRAVSKTTSMQAAFGFSFL
jgi:hypothetical protein